MFPSTLSPFGGASSARQASGRTSLAEAWLGEAGQVVTGGVSAQWVAESGTRSETTGYQVGLEEIPAHEHYALVDISEQDLEDTVFNLEAEMQSEFAEQFAKAEGSAFVSFNRLEGYVNKQHCHGGSMEPHVLDLDGRSPC